jgi:hypothetical protein
MTEDLWARFGLAVLATWRVTHLLSSEDGPADLVVRFRARLGHGVAGKLMDCFNCLSLWVSVPTAFFVSRQPVVWMFAWLALSGGACLLERLGGQPVVIQPVSNGEEGETENVLRSQTISDDEYAKTSQHAKGA